ncbi:hypothetical protein MP638_005818 [Amoeboaphelidium occidentale]|nr:hypothetical protein MP638_005818 [Amoeboaphelidium occidentale]
MVDERKFADLTAFENSLIQSLKKCQHQQRLRILYFVLVVLMFCYFSYHYASIDNLYSMLLLVSITMYTLYKTYANSTTEQKFIHRTNQQLKPFNLYLEHSSSSTAVGQTQSLWVLLNDFFFPCPYQLWFDSDHVPASFQISYQLYKSGVQNGASDDKSNDTKWDTQTVLNHKEHIS